MASTTVDSTVDVTANKRNIRRVFGEIQERYESFDATPVLRQIVRDTEELHGQRFDSGRGPGGPLKPLAKVTVENKGHDTILVDKGRYKASLASRTGDSIRQLFRDEQQQGAIYGTRVDYAIYHQKGTGRIPQRQIIGYSQHEAAAIIQRLRHFVIIKIVATKSKTT